MRKKLWCETYPRWNLVLRPRQKFDGYSGDLAEPLFIDPSEWPPHSETNDKVRRLPTREQRDYAKWVEVQARLKVEQLFEFFDVEPGDWENLAWMLIYWHVPGLTITHDRPRRVGAPKKRSLDSDKALVAHIEQMRLEVGRERRKAIEGVKLADAIRRSIKRDPRRWPGQKGRTMSEASATARYREAKRRVERFERLRGPLGKLFNNASPKDVQKFIEKML